MSRHWTIEGKTYTARKLADELDIHYSSARARLKRCTTLEELLRPREHDGTGCKEKTYIVENKEFTCKKLAEELGTNVHTARYRLLKSKTIDELYKPIVYGNFGGRRNISKKEIQDREMFKFAMGAI